MSKNTVKKWTALFCALLMAVQLLPVTASAKDARTPAVSSNINQQDYDVWSKPVESYLYTRDDGGLTRVEYINRKVVVEDYDDGLNLTASRTITPELPVWGGFFAGERANFLFFGQNNPDESKSAEVIRVVKYSKDWKRLDSVSLYGANTQNPFDAGSLRADECGQYLYVRTCHTMHKTHLDNYQYNHQANMTFCVDTDSMTVTDSFYDIGNDTVGYVSHSFNQFLIVNQDNRLVALDHGDSAPTRGVVFMKYYAKADTGEFTTTYYEGRICSFGLMQRFGGQDQDNYTGASVGGLAETSGAYIMAYNDNGTGAGTQNRVPYYHWMNKSDGRSWSAKLENSNFPAGSSTPVLAPTGLNGGYMLWNEKTGCTVSKKMHYLSYGADGQPIAIKDAEAPLSDCQPIPYKGGAVWYVTENSEPTFYTIGEAGVTAHAVGSGSVDPNPNPDPDPDPTPGSGLTPVEGVRDPRTEPTVKDAARMAAKLQTRFVHSPGYTAHVGKDGTYDGISDVVQVTNYQIYSGNNYGSFCLTKDGNVYVSGDLSSVGLPGDYSDANVKLTDNARAISAYDTYGGLMVIDKDNNLWQYTSGGRSRKPILTDVDSVVSGFNRHAALKRDGSVWFWGEDGFGCDTKVLDVYLHDGPRPVSELLGKDKNIVSIGFDNENGWAIDENGGLWCWGSNNVGQIGNNGDFDIRCTVSGNIPGIENPVKVIESGVISAFPGMAVLKDGSVLRWSTNSTYYRSPYDTESLVPVKTPEQRMLAGDLNVSDEGHLYNSVCMMDFMSPADRPAYTGGDTEILGITTDRDTGYTTVKASSVTGEALEYGMAFQDYSPSSKSAPIHWQTSNQFPGLEPGDYTFYVRVRGTFGDAPHAPGATHSDTHTVVDHTLVPVEGLGDPRMEPTVRDAARMAAKLRTRFQMPTGAGVVWTDKDNTFHHNLDTSTIPEKVVQVDSYEGDETVFALTESGNVWVKGNIGCVGLGGSSGAYSAYFVKLNLSDPVRYISADSDGLMIIYNKFNGLYQVHGIGGTPYLPFQMRVSFIASNVDSVVSGFHRHAALKRDGSVWFWGEDGFGCGRKLVGIYLHGEPRQFSKLLDKDKHIVSVGFDNENGWAIDDEGALWCWGSNEYGQIGNGGRHDSFSNAAGHIVYGVEKPVKVIDRDVISAAPGMAVLKDGSVLRWGDETGSLTPVPTGEQRMLAGAATVDEYGRLTYTSDSRPPVFIQNFIPADSRPEYKGDAPVIHSITLENGYTVVNASAAVGEVLEYGVAYGDHTLLSADANSFIRWQPSNRLLLEPGEHDIYVRVRGTFGSGAHASGTVLSDHYTVPGPFYIRVNGQYAYIYSVNGAPTGNEGLTAVLAGYDKDGKLVGMFTSPVKQHSFWGDTSWGNGFHISEWRNVNRLKGFLLDSRTQAPRAAAPVLDLNVK